MPPPALAETLQAADTTNAANAAMSDTALDANAGAEQTPQAVPFAMAQDSDFPLPAEVGYLPASNPAAPVLATPLPEAASDATAVVAGADDSGAIADSGAGDAQLAAPLPASRPNTVTDGEATTEVAMLDAQQDVDQGGAQQSIETVSEMPVAAAPKRKSLLASLFGSSPTNKPIVRDGQTKPLLPQSRKTFIERDNSKPIVEVSNSPPRPVVMASLGNDNALPGVRQTALFEIKRKSGIDDDSDVDIHEDEIGGSIRLASAAGLARLAPNGLLKQTDHVDVACLKPSLVRVLKTIEKHYGRPLVVTSGYRSPSHNRRARGAKNSLHMFCAAADIQVAGVAKWDLASYARSMQGRGGVGTYCNTDSVHVDVGPERDWNWRCRRRK